MTIYQKKKQIIKCMLCKWSAYILTQNKSASSFDVENWFRGLMFHFP